MSQVTNCLFFCSVFVSLGISLTTTQKSPNLRSGYEVHGFVLQKFTLQAGWPYIQSHLPWECPLCPPEINLIISGMTTGYDFYIRVIFKRVALQLTLNLILTFLRQNIGLTVMLYLDQCHWRSPCLCSRSSWATSSTFSSRRRRRLPMTPHCHCRCRSPSPGFARRITPTSSTYLVSGLCSRMRDLKARLGAIHATSSTSTPT